MSSSIRAPDDDDSVDCYGQSMTYVSHAPSSSSFSEDRHKEPEVSSTLAVVTETSRCVWVAYAVVGLAMSVSILGAWTLVWLFKE